MVERVARFAAKHVFPGNFRLSLTQRLSVLLLLPLFALMTTSCGMPAQAAGAQNFVPNDINRHNLFLSGIFPSGKVNQSYDAMLLVLGGSAPYHFSVKTGALPAGVSMNPTTGTFSGRPTTAGTYAFEVIVTDSPRLEEGSQTFAVTIGAGSSSGSGSGNSVAVSVSPANATLFSSQKQQYTATVSGTSNTAVTWSATAGTINSNGLYTAPTVTAQTNATVTATSSADSSKSASATATVNPVNTTTTLQITSGSLPQGQQGATYGEVFTATGGTPPYSWSISAGAAPAGITMASTGDLAGIPTALGAFNFTVTVTDTMQNTATGNFSVTVIAGSNFDGPAELPRVTVPSAMADTPAPGTVISVNAGGDLQTALDNANCGDTIQLQAGATFTGKVMVPAKNCDINHWIIIRTSAPDSVLPAEGQRATPCYAGVASLVGRPQYSCPNAQNVMAKIQMQAGGDGPIQFATGANFYRFTGLEMTRPAGTPGSARLMSGKGTVDHLVVDRSWLHGALQDETHAGLDMDGMTNVAVVDSYFSDFHCIAVTGSCTDAHAVAGGVSDTQDGPYKIQDNFLEASGEAILLGGGPATFSPADIEILNNHFWKPWQWMPGSPNFIGGVNGRPFIVKNHLELKNAVRVLVDSNLMENSWGGFSQSGFGIVITPKNQHTTNGSNVCPACKVTDVTIRYTQISHAGAGIQMATNLSDTTSAGAGAPALAGARWSLHDLVIDDLNPKYDGGGSLFEIMNNWPENGLNNLTINHITAFPYSGSHAMVVGNMKTNQPMSAFVFTNNLITTGRYPIWNAGGGSGSCAYEDVPITSLTKCFTPYTFGYNGLVASPTSFPPSVWPTNNMFPQSVNDVEFVNYSDGVGGNYELQPTSPYIGKGSDGKNLGADIVGLTAALANVQ